MLTKIAEILATKNLGKPDEFKILDFTLLKEDNFLLLTGGTILYSSEPILIEGDLTISGESQQPAILIVESDLYCNNLEMKGSAFLFSKGSINVSKEFRVDTSEFGFVTSGPVKVNETIISNHDIPKDLLEIPSDALGEIKGTNENIQNILARKQQELAENAPFSVKIVQTSRRIRPEEDYHNNIGGISLSSNLVVTTRSGQDVFCSCAWNYIDKLYWLSSDHVKCVLANSKRAYGKNIALQIDLKKQVFYFAKDTTAVPWGEMVAYMEGGKMVLEF